MLRALSLEEDDELLGFAWGFKSAIESKRALIDTRPSRVTQVKRQTWGHIPSDYDSRCHLKVER